MELRPWHSSGGYITWEIQDHGLWNCPEMGLSPGSVIYLLCDLRKVTSSLWASVFPTCKMGIISVSIYRTLLRCYVLRWCWEWGWIESKCSINAYHFCIILFSPKGWHHAQFPDGETNAWRRKTLYPDYWTGKWQAWVSVPRASHWKTTKECPLWIKKMGHLYQEMCVWWGEDIDLSPWAPNLYLRYGFKL